MPQLGIAVLVPTYIGWWRVWVFVGWVEQSDTQHSVGSEHLNSLCWVFRSLIKRSAYLREARMPQLGIASLVPIYVCSRWVWIL